MLVLPVVDMQAPSAPTDIVQACKEMGFFYLENHGVSKEVMEQVFQASKAFFSLSHEDKMSVKADKNNRGFTPMHEEMLDPSSQVKGDTKEAFYVFREVIAGSEEDSKPLTGPNQWPSEHLLPGWKKTVQDHFNRMLALDMKLAGMLATGLGLGSSFFDDFFSESLSALRLNHYSAEVSNVEKGVMGTGAHSDYGVITMLATDDVPGLQVKLHGEWHDAPPRPGAFICNIGNMVERWTNGQLQPTVHRVINKLGRERYSIPFFLQPSFDAEVTCLPQFCSEDNPAKYPPVTFGMYLSGRYSKTHQDFDGNQDN
eukprot:jgi/Undpi1/2029/HiC_scaffold_12.g05415.m1